MQTRDRELAQAQQQLQSSEVLVADFQKSLLQKDSELETLRAKKVIISTINSRCEFSSVYYIDFS